MGLQVVFYLRFFLQRSGQGLIDVDLVDDARFKDDTEFNKPLVKLIFELFSHLFFQIKDLRQPDSVDEGPHTLFNLGFDKFVKSGSSQFVDEVLDLRLSSRKSKCEIKINGDVGVIFGGAVSDRSIVLDHSLGHHASDSLMFTIAPLGSWLHDASVLATGLLERGQARGDVHLQFAATAGFSDHNQHNLLVRARVCQQSGRFFDA